MDLLGLTHVWAILLWDKLSEIIFCLRYVFENGVGLVRRKGLMTPQQSFFAREVVNFGTLLLFYDLRTEVHLTIDPLTFQLQ